MTTPVVTPPVVVPAPITSSTLQWGAYVGDGSSAISDFESLVGNKMDIVADFEDFNASFPTGLSSNVGQQGKTLLVFWEPSSGFDSIINGSLDSSIKAFASGAKSYGYPVILAPFDEMNLNESDWGYGANGNTPAKFKAAWIHIHDMFSGVSNVKFAIDYNNVSIPNSSLAILITVSLVIPSKISSLGGGVTSFPFLTIKIFSPGPSQIYPLSVKNIASSKPF